MTSTPRMTAERLVRRTTTLRRRAYGRRTLDPEPGGSRDDIPGDASIVPRSRCRIVAASSPSLPGAARRQPSGSAARSRRASSSPVGCRDSGPGHASAGDQSPTTAPSSPPADRNPAAFVAGVPYVVSVDPSQFTTTVTNPYFPLDPGTTWTFDGAGEHVVVAVTDRTRVIAGVTTIVVHDQAFEDGEVVEDTEDYYAQDAAGNVWYFGEVTGECDGHKVTSRAGSWETGVAGAQPGAVMLADPRVGDVYRQEYLAGEAEDQATILKLDGAVTGPAGSYTRRHRDQGDHTPRAGPPRTQVVRAGCRVVREDSLGSEPGVVEMVKVTTGERDAGRRPVPSHRVKGRLADVSEAVGWLRVDDGATRRRGVRKVRAPQRRVAGNARPP